MQISVSDTTTVHCPPTPKTSPVSNDDEDENLNKLIGNPWQRTPHVSQRRRHPIQMCHQLPTIPEIPGSATMEKWGHSDIFAPVICQTLMQQRLVTLSIYFNGGGKLAEPDITCAPWT